MATQTSFQGFSFPTTTPVPDELFDVLLPQLSGAELKVLLYICRRTFGFKKESDTISLNQIASGITTRDGRVLDRGTGLCKVAVAMAVRSLAEKGIIPALAQAAAKHSALVAQQHAVLLNPSVDSDPAQTKML